jgi:phenylacetate-coenzyme A ligase PaaK-like adenylate-forming protein
MLSLPKTKEDDDDRFADSTGREQFLELLNLGLRGAEKRDARWRRLELHQRLPAFLQHAKNSVPYYQRLFSNWSRIPTMEDFPIVSRSDVAGCRADFVSRRFRKLADTLYTHTNRSVDMILKVGFDHAELYEINHGIYERLKTVIPDVAELAEPGRVSVCIIADTPRQLHSSALLIPWKASICRRLFLGSGDEAEVVRYLARLNLPLLYGRPSNLVQLAEIARVEGVRITPKAVFVSGENLFDDDQEKIRESFSSRIVNAYIATEGGMIALACPLTNVLHVQEDRVLLEVLDDNGHIKDEGMGHILLTNHSNRCSVFIRYKVGDRGTIAKTNCICGFSGTTIVDLPGKEKTEFRFPDRIVPVSRLADIFAEYPVRQFQVTQVANRDLHVRWIPAVSESQTINLAIERKIQQIVGEGRCRAEMVSRINVPGGKQKRFTS